MVKNKKEGFVADDLFKFKFLSNVSYNASGSCLAFNVTMAQEKTNDYHSDVYCYKNNKLLQLTANINANVLCWLNNDELLVKRKNDKSKRGSDIYKININGGEAIPYIHVNFKLSSLKVINANKYVALGVIDANDCDAYLDDDKTYNEKKELAEKNKDYQVIDEIPYWRNGLGFTNKQRNALFVIQDGQVKRISGQYDDVSEYVVNGDKVYYLCKTFISKYKLTSQIYCYDSKTNKVKDIYSKDDLSINNLFIKGNNLYALVSDMKIHGSHQSGVISKVLNNKFSFICDPQRTLSNSSSGDTTYGGGSNNDSVNDNWYTLATEDDHVEIWHYDSDFNKEVIFAKQGLITCLSASKDNIAFIHEDDSHLGEIYLYNIKSKSTKKLSSFNDSWLKDKYIAKPKRIDYVSTDTNLHGWVLLPQDFNKNKKYPAVLDIHGGPRAIYATSLSHEMQMWVSKGFVVFFANIRGSDGLGDEFANINGHYGEIDYQNLMDFTDAVLKKYKNIDAKKVCETGGSYGGYMSNWIVAHTNRFAAVASQRSISNWVTKIFISDIGFWYNSEQHNAKDTLNNFANLWQASPLKYVKGAKTPTLFIHSDQDYRCPLPEGMQFMQALAAQGVETKMVIFHGENHGLSRTGKPLHRIRRLNEITDWFIKHTK